jgi:thiamine kinase-like enzyme
MSVTDHPRSYESTRVSAPGEPPELSEVIARLSALLGPRSGTVEQLRRGVTNRSFKVDFGGDRYVVQLAGPGSERLGIDREVECAANKRAGELQIAPTVAAMLHEPSCLVTHFVDGHQPTAEELARPEQLARVARALRAMHESGEQLSKDFNPFRTIEAYADGAAEAGVEIPGDRKARRGQLRKAEKALGSRKRAEPAPCHNDLLTNNFTIDGDRLVISDWEYAGMGDPYFDLGNFAASNELDAAAEEHLLDAYFGSPPTAQQRAILRLMRFVSDLREGMWGFFQSGISELDIDFAGWGRKHLERAAATAEDEGFRSSLKEASG